MSEEPPQHPQEKDKVPLVPEYRGKEPHADKPLEEYRKSVFLQILGGFWGYLGLLVASAYSVGWASGVFHWDPAVWYWLTPVMAFVIFSCICLLLRTPVAFVTALIMFVVMLTMCSICGTMLQGI